MIRVDNLTKRFGRVVAVDGISFEVREGEVLGFLGPNGAGKSTTLRMIVGLTTPTAGCVTVAGHDSRSDSLAIRRMIGHLPERTPLYVDMRVKSFLRFAAEAKGIPRADRPPAIDRAIAECGLEEMRGRQIRHLSRGYRQRVGLAQAILGDPRVLILDEPTVGLDPKQIIEIRHLIRGWAGRRTVILSTHILPEVEVTCDRIIIISDGRLRAEGTPAHLAAESKRSPALSVEMSAPPEQVREALCGLEEIDSAQSAGDSGARLTLSGCDLSAMRKAVVREAASRGWEIVHLSAAVGGLERAFLDAIGEEAKR
jgi:gliding motility-associated transport system ATP-binding protein